MSCHVYMVSSNFVTHATCVLACMTYKYNELQMYSATQKLNYKANCKTPFFPIKVLTFDFSNNRFLKWQTCTFKLTKLELFAIPKLTCIQFAHSFKKDIVEVQFSFHVFNERETQNQINIKSFIFDANLLFLILKCTDYSMLTNTPTCNGNKNCIKKSECVH
jgi:hypothetical protein